MVDQNGPLHGMDIGENRYKEMTLQPLYKWFFGGPFGEY